MRLVHEPFAYFDNLKTIKGLDKGWHYDIEPITYGGTAIYAIYTTQSLPNCISLLDIHYRVEYVVHYNTLNSLERITILKKA